MIELKNLQTDSYNVAIDCVNDEHLMRTCWMLANIYICSFKLMHLKTWIQIEFGECKICNSKTYLFKVNGKFVKFDLLLYNSKPLEN